LVFISSPSMRTKQRNSLREFYGSGGAVLGGIRTRAALAEGSVRDESAKMRTLA
jgi:hypothetical protein